MIININDVDKLLCRLSYILSEEYVIIDMYSTYNIKSTYFIINGYTTYSIYNTNWSIKQRIEMRDGVNAEIYLYE